MKNKIKVFLTFIFVIILSVVIFSGCSGNRYPRELILADNIADKEPKRAIAKLDSMKPQIKDAGEAVKNYYTLLRIKANDKAYAKHTSDTTILRLVDYYEKGGDKKLLPVAYYYAGRVYRDLQDAPKALDYFQKAEEAVKERTPENKKLLAYIYGQIGTVLDYQGFYKEALEAFLQENAMFTSIADTTGLIYNLRDIGGIYWDLEKLDSALYFYKKADKLAVAIHDKYASADINEQMASFYLHTGNIHAAWKCMRYAAPYDDPRNASSTLSIYSILYEKAGYKDSAFICYKRLLSVGNIYGKQGAYEGLTKYYFNKGEYKEANKYFDLYMAVTDSIKKINVSEAIAKSISMYDYKIREKENYELKIKIQNERTRNVILSCIAISLFFIILFVVFIFRHKNYIMRLKLEQIELQNSEIMEKSLKKKYKQKEQIETSVIYKTIQNKIGNYQERHEALTNEEWLELRNTVNRIYENFDKNLYDIYKVSDSEYKVSLLIKINISPKHIACLTNYSRESITSIRRRLYAKAFKDKEASASPSKWDIVIHSL